MFDTKLLSSKFSLHLLNRTNTQGIQNRQERSQTSPQGSPETGQEYCTRGPDDFDWSVKFYQFPQIRAHIFDNYFDFTSQFWFNGYHKLNIWWKNSLSGIFGHKHGPKTQIWFV